MTIPITVGICAYNEEANIERTLRSLFSQESGVYALDSVIVVSSGSTDRTDAIVESMIPEFPCIRLIRQEKREGKNSAINLILREKGTEIVVLLNADNILGSPDSLNRLIEPFSDPKVGMVGGHPVPVNDRDTVAGFTSHLVWTMHHHVSQMSPKIGELMAFRDIGKGLPTDKQSDEDILRLCDDLRRNGNRVVVGSNTFAPHWAYVWKMPSRPLMHFDALYASHLIHIAKPEPEFWQFICRSEHSAPEETVFIDDLEENCNAARSIGINTFLYKGDGRYARLESFIGAL